MDFQCFEFLQELFMMYIKRSKQFFNRLPYTSKLVKIHLQDGCCFLGPLQWCDKIYYLKVCEVDFRDVIENNKFVSVLSMKCLLISLDFLATLV